MTDEVNLGSGWLRPPERRALAELGPPGAQFQSNLAG